MTREDILNLMKEETWFTGEEAKFFNVTVGQGTNFVNYVGTNQNSKIPKEILNKADHKWIKLKAKEVARLENLSKEIEIINRRDLIMKNQ